MEKSLFPVGISLLLLFGAASYAQSRPFTWNSSVGTIRYVVKGPIAPTTSEPLKACADTVLDEARMAFFVKNAVVSTATNYSRALIQGDCTAEGFVLADEGNAYRLTIDSSTGWGAMESGPRTTYLYCEKCEGILEKDFNHRQ